MKKRLFALIFAAMLTGMCCVSCEDSGGESEKTLGASYSENKNENDNGKTSSISYSEEDEEDSPKSQIGYACADAKRMMTLANQALAEMDEEGIKCTLYGWVDIADRNVGGEVTDLFNRMASYGDAVNKVEFSVYIKNGAAVSGCAKYGKHYGCYPGRLSVDNYDEKLGENPDFDDAKAAAIRFYNEEYIGDEIS